MFDHHYQVMPRAGALAASAALRFEDLGGMPDMDDGLDAFIAKDLYRDENMAIIYSDSDIQSLLRERKPLDTDFRSGIRLRDALRHQRYELDFTGVEGSRFRLMLRKNKINIFDFSIILGVYPHDSSRLFRLCRYNGKSHEHTNPIESIKFHGFHIHIATERYQDFGFREDAYAEPTDRFSDFDTALQCMVNDCGFVFSGSHGTNFLDET